MLQKIQCTLLAPCTSFSNIIWSLKIFIIRISGSYLYGQARNAQNICKKCLHLYTDNEKSKISTNLNTVSIILLHSVIISLANSSIGATVNYYLLLLPLQTGKCYMCHNLSSLLYSKM